MTIACATLEAGDLRGILICPSACVSPKGGEATPINRGRTDLTGKNHRADSGIPHWRGRSSDAVGFGKGGTGRRRF